jgi:endonuclease/exonuclease/phosphatase family metal-dependent hydrolase
MPKRIAYLLLAIVLAAGCRTGRNYPDTTGPRYAGRPAPVASVPGARGDTIHVVSFNIAFGRRADSAIKLFKTDPALRNADLILLQEMDAPSTRRVAAALGFWYVYYPAIFSLTTQRDFGNAVLSRWPIVQDEKIVLPHVSRYARTQRTATAATIRIGSSDLRVYSTHLSTIFDIRSSARADQLRAILTDAAKYPRVIIGGDMNSSVVGRLARDMGYEWPTERGPHTTAGGRWDHIFFKGLTTPDMAAGTVSRIRGASDHRPVWATAVLGSQESRRSLRSRDNSSPYSRQLGFVKRITVPESEVVSVADICDLENTAPVTLDCSRTLTIASPPSSWARSRALR